MTFTESSELKQNSVYILQNKTQIFLYANNTTHLWCKQKDWVEFNAEQYAFYQYT